MKPVKYHKVTVTMKNGFTYSYTCIGRLLEGLKKNSQGYWTEKIEVVEITEEEYEKRNEVVFEPEITTKTKVGTRKSDKPEKPVKLEPKKATKGIPQFSSLEDFFDSSEPAPKNKKLKKRV